MTRIVTWTIAGMLTVAGLAVLTVTPDGLNPLVGWALIMAAIGIASAIPTPIRPADSYIHSLNEQRDVRRPLDRRDVDLWCQQLHAADPQQIIDEAQR